MIPPITAVAIGARNDPPSPTPSADGSMPADMAIEVITMGRARLCPASIIALVRDMPCAVISMAKSTSRMAFLVTIPISIRMPIKTGIDTGEPVTIRAAATPPIAKGSENRMVKGWMTDLNSKISTVSTSARPRIIELMNDANSSVCTSASPVSLTRTPAGRVMPATNSSNRALAVPSATPSGRLAPMVAVRSRFSRSTVLGPTATRMSATDDSGTAAPVAVSTLSAPILPRSDFRSPFTCTRTGISRSSTDTLASAASTSPMVATRTVSAICAVVMPSRAA